MYKTEEEQKLEDEANKFTYLNKVIDNLKVKQQNGRLWTPYHDMQLYEYVIKYKFNFYDISNAFQKLCTNDKKYEYSEDAVRLHWAFLHAMRHFEQTPDEAYYQRMKLQYDKEKPKSFKNTVEEREKMLSEEEDIKRMKEELEKIEKDKEKKEKKIKEEKEKKEKERIEKEKKEEEEVEELICTTTKRKDKSENKNEEIKKEEIKNEEMEKNEEKINNGNNSNKLYDENNEPEFIKQLFSKKIPQEILDKLNKDKEKYNSNINNLEENNKIINEDNKENNERQNIINDNNSLNKPKEENLEINSNINIDSETLKKEKENDKNNNIINNINDEEDDLFPIKSNKQKEISEPGKLENINMEQELRNTQDFNDYIQSNPELKKQYDQLNNYCNFAVKSLNYIVNKGAGMNNTSETEAKKIEQANNELNKLLLEPIMKKTEEEGFTLEDWNKKIEEEEHKMNFETTNYDNYMKNAPKDEERDMKLNKFKEHLFGFAEKISTEELLEKITGIIGQQNINDNNNNEENNNLINNNINNNNNINLENRIQNFMNNLENNNIEDEKSEITKEQSESINDNAGEDNGRNTISSVTSSEFPKKYRHVYRGMVYYTDKPDENDKKNKNNNRSNNNKKKKDEDDEIEEDDDEDDDDYNK